MLFRSLNMLSVPWYSQIILYPCGNHILHFVFNVLARQLTTSTKKYKSLYQLNPNVMARQLTTSTKKLKRYKLFYGLNPSNTGVILSKGSRVLG